MGGRGDPELLFKIKSEQPIKTCKSVLSSSLKLMMAHKNITSLRSPLKFKYTPRQLRTKRDKERKQRGKLIKTRILTNCGFRTFRRGGPSDIDSGWPSMKVSLDDKGAHEYWCGLLPLTLRHVCRLTNATHFRFVTSQTCDDVLLRDVKLPSKTKMGKESFSSLI